MSEILEFDAVHEYSLFKIGIAADATLQNGDFSVDIDSELTPTRLIVFLKGITAKH